MTTTSALIACLLLGQVSGTVDDNSPMGSATAAPPSNARPSEARRNGEASKGFPRIRFGTPTPADPPPGGNVIGAPASPQASDLQFSSPEDGGASPRGNTFNDAPAQFQSAPPSNSPSNFSAASGGLQRAAANEPTDAPPAATSHADSNADATAPATRQLIEQAFPTAADAGEATPQLSLRAVLAAAPDRARRRVAIQTYWEASTLLADWQFAAEEFELLRQVSAPSDAAQQSVLAAAQAAAQARLVEAEMAAKSAQFALADAAPAATAEGDGAPPLPVDTPWAGKYNTHFETIFSARVPPTGLRRIHETMPLRQGLVDARAEAVHAAAAAVDRQIDAYHNGRASLAALLKEFENLRTQRGAFLGAVRDYNLDIAEYALGIARPNDSPEKIVRMLIDVPASATGVADTSGMRSVLVAPAGTSSPAGTSPTTIIQRNPPTNRAAPTTPMPARFADPSGGSATALPRPPTERVLGTLRDVTNRQQPEVAQPRSRFSQPDSDAGAGSNLPIGSSNGSSNGSSTPPQSGGATASGAASGGAQIVVPSENAPALPPLTP